MSLIVRDVGPQLLQGCCHEAERAKTVGLYLEGLRNSLVPALHGTLQSLISEIYRTGRRLRDLADHSQVHLNRVPEVVNYLNVLLPCLGKSLMDITAFVKNKAMTKEQRWRAMYHEMGSELAGTTLPARFIMYNQYIQLLEWLLIRSPNFDMNNLVALRRRIFKLRAARNIPPPSPMERQAITWPDAYSPEDESNSHWAENIFSRTTPTYTELEKPAVPSQAYGKFQPAGYSMISPNVKTLAKRSFDNGHISVTFFLQTLDEAPYLLLRSFSSGQHWVETRGAHELVVERTQQAVLTFTRWSKREGRHKTWASLNFRAWEELVLFYCTFACLKSRSILKVSMKPTELVIKKEKRLFSAIEDDGFHHALAIYEERRTGQQRLHASVWDGPLKNCPVWTAFVPPLTPNKRWLQRKGRQRIWLYDLEPFVFCERYRVHRQRRGRHGAFELSFIKEAAAERFEEVFDTRSLADEGESSAR